MQKVSKKEQERLEAIAMLRDLIDPSRGIVIIQKSVSASGMQRGLNIYTHDLDCWLTNLVADALGWGLNKNDNLKVNGCGMDMHFHTAYALTHALYSEEERKELTGNGSGCLPWRSL